MALKNTRQCRIQTFRYAGAPVIQTLIKGGREDGLPKKFAFWRFGPQFGLKIREGDGPPAPSPGSATARKPSGSVIYLTINE